MHYKEHWCSSPRKKEKMKKLLFICFFAICGCLGFCPDSQAKMLIKNQKAGPHCTWSLSEDGVMTIRGKGKVKLQSNLAWANKGNVKQVIIQKGITGIGEYAFGNYDNLTEIKLPKTVNELEEEAFAYCDNLVYITLSPNIRQAIYNCCSLKSVTFPKKLKSKENLIEKCYSLRKVCNHSCLKIPLDTAKGHRVWRSKGKLIKTLAPKSTAKSLGTRYKLTYDLRGGTAKEELPQYRYYGDKTPLPEAEKEGYRFVGWRDMQCWSYDEEVIVYSERNLKISAYFIKYEIKLLEDGGLLCKVNDDGFYFVDIFERCPIKYYVHFSEDGGKTWWNSGGGRGDGTGFIQKLGENDIEKGKIYLYEITYSIGDYFEPDDTVRWFFRDTIC